MISESDSEDNIPTENPFLHGSGPIPEQNHILGNVKTEDTTLPSTKVKNESFPPSTKVKTANSSPSSKRNSSSAKVKAESGVNSAPKVKTEKSSTSVKGKKRKSNGGTPPMVSERALGTSCLRSCAWHNRQSGR